MTARLLRREKLSCAQTEADPETVHSRRDGQCLGGFRDEFPKCDPNQRWPTTACPLGGVVEGALWPPGPAFTMPFAFRCFHIWGLADLTGTAPPRATQMLETETLTPHAFQAQTSNPESPPPLPYGLSHSRPPPTAFSTESRYQTTGAALSPEPAGITHPCQSRASFPTSPLPMGTHQGPVRGSPRPRPLGRPWPLPWVPAQCSSPSSQEL